MKLIDIIIVLIIILIILGVIIAYIYKRYKKIPTGDCACCHMKSKRTLKKIRKSLRN